MGLNAADASAGSAARLLDHGACPCRTLRKQIHVGSEPSAYRHGPHCRGNRWRAWNRSLPAIDLGPRSASRATRLCDSAYTVSLVHEGRLPAHPNYFGWAALLRDNVKKKNRGQRPF